MYWDNELCRLGIVRFRPKTDLKTFDESMEGKTGLDSGYYSNYQLNLDYMDSLYNRYNPVNISCASKKICQIFDQSEVKIGLYPWGSAVA